MAAKVLGQDVGDRRDAGVLLRGVLGTDKEAGEDTFDRVEQSLDLSPGGRFFASDGLYRSFDPPVALAPLIVGVQHNTNGIVRPTGWPRFDDPKPISKQYYFWFFGYVAKLPLEQEVPGDGDISHYLDTATSIP